jgi:hypothetical protein
MNPNIASNFKPRASSLGLLMSDAARIDPRLVTPEIKAIQKMKVADRSDADLATLQGALDRTLSAGAKSYMQDIAREYQLDFHKVVTTKYMEKGLAVENDAIALYNSVFFTDYTKNTERKTNEWVTGECDIHVPEKRRTIDAKSSWDKSTFPLTAAEAHDSLYEWQGRAYMMLWDAIRHDVAFLLVSTPDELIRYEQQDLHLVDNVDEEKRVTVVTYLRELALEEKIKVKITAARAYLAELLATIEREHAERLESV